MKDVMYVIPSRHHLCLNRTSIHKHRDHQKAYTTECQDLVYQLTDLLFISQMGKLILCEWSNKTYTNAKDLPTQKRADTKQRKRMQPTTVFGLQNVEYEPKFNRNANTIIDESNIKNVSQFVSLGYS